MNNTDIIYRSEAIGNLMKQSKLTKSVVRRVLMQTESIDVVSRPVVEQIKWERDVAIEQLKEHGIQFGGVAPDVVKVVRCRECQYGEVDDNDFPNQYLCKHNGYDWNNGEHFCSYGERREENVDTEY